MIEVKMMHTELYKSMAHNINRKLARKAITASEIERMVARAKKVRAKYGVMGLMQYASQLPQKYFTEAEIEQLKASPEWDRFTRQMSKAMIDEGVLTSWEAQMLRRCL
jgi:hypothetical protein